MKQRVTIKTYKVVLILVALLLCLLIGRLAYITMSKTVDGIDLEAFANNRNKVTKELYAKRGTIYDASNEPLAQNVNLYTLIAYLSPTRTTNEEKPQHVVDKEGTAKALAEVINMEENEILRILNKAAYQVEFGKAGKLNQAEKEKVEALKLPGIDFMVSQTRYYKMGSFASYLIGYAKPNDSGEITGELGIESYYNTNLKGINGSTEYQQDAYGYKMANVPEYTKEATDGNDVYLTIDSNIQLIAENAMKSISDKYKMEWGLLAVMEAKTGAIVASATVPTFNPNDLSTITSYMNPLVSYIYEPGSTMKTFSFAAAIDSDNYKGSATFKSGSIDVADVTIRDSNREGWGVISYDKAFAYSSNVGATKLALKMGTATLRDYYTNLGFGAKTGIELSAEAVGKIDFTYQSELATASFGQGITVTPIQMLQALTTIANDGVMLKPYIVNKVVDPNGEIVEEYGRQELGQVFKKDTTDYMKKLMYDVIYNGLSKMWQPSNVTLIGKTGTAQIASPKGGYLKGEYDYVTSLAGLFPDDNPEYIIYIVTKKMQGPRSAQAKALTKAVDEIAAYAKLTKKDNEGNKDLYSSITLDNYLSRNVSEVKEELSDFDVYIIGDGEYITSQYPNKDTLVFTGSKVFLKTNGSKIVMEDLSGFSRNEVNVYSSMINKNISVSGYGYVINQSKTPNEELSDNDEISVVLEQKNMNS